MPPRQIRGLFSGSSAAQLRANRTQQYMPSAQERGCQAFPAAKRPWLRRLVVGGDLVEHLLGIGSHRKNAGNRHFAGGEHGDPDCRQPQGRPACGQRDPAEYLPRGSIEQGLLFQCRLDDPQPQAGKQNNPGDRGQGVHPNGRVPPTKPRSAASGTNTILPAQSRPARRWPASRAAERAVPR